MKWEDHPMQKTLLSVIALTLLLQIAAARPQNPREQEHKSLDIYYIDTEGGKAVLFVSPAGETLMYDTGTGGDGDRDLDRILAVIKAANLPVEQLDHVIVSHYHGDHAGNSAALADKLPIRNFYDHGGWTVELQPNRSAAFNAYRPIRDKAHVTVPKTGAKSPITGFDVTVVANAGEIITSAVSGMPGAGTPNPQCRQFVPKIQDATPENHYAMGVVIKYGNFKMLDLSDLTWNQEKDLVCPNNLLGTNFDVYNTSRHGTELRRKSGSRACGAAQGGCNEQQPNEGRNSGYVQDRQELTGTPRLLAITLLGECRQGNQLPRSIHREYRRDTDKSSGTFPQAVGPDRWQLHSQK